MEQPSSNINKPNFLEAWDRRPFRIGSAATNPELASVVTSLALCSARSLSEAVFVDACCGSGTILASVWARLQAQACPTGHALGLEQSLKTAQGANANMEVLASMHGCSKHPALVLHADASEPWQLPISLTALDDFVVVGNLPWGETVRDDNGSIAQRIVLRAAEAGAHTAVFVTSDSFELPSGSPWKVVTRTRTVAGRPRGAQNSGPYACSVLLLQQEHHLVYR